MTAHPRVDVVIPALNEEACILRCLRHVVAQDHPPHLVDVVVVDAGSTDGTVELVRAFAAEEPRVRVLTGLGRLNAGAALNAGIAAGSGELIARVDAHTYIAADYVSRAVALLDQHPDVALVGGQPLQVGETRFGEAVALARRSRFGVGGSVYSDRRRSAFVDTVQAGVYRRDALPAVDGFATTMLVSEDEECNWRLRKAGFRVLLDDSVHFTYTTRSTWRAVFRQHRNYGRGRVRVVVAHPEYLRLRHVAPSAFILALGGLSTLALVDRRARRGVTALIGAYAGGAATSALRASAGADRSLAPLVAGCFLAQHLGYGIGVLGGALAHLGAVAGLLRLPGAVTRR